METPVQSENVNWEVREGHAEEHEEAHVMMEKGHKL